MKIRTIDKGYDEFKATVDPGTSISRHDWRQIVITKQLKSVRRSGKRYLYDMDEMVEFLQNPQTESTTEKTEALYGKLRRIN